MFRQFLDTRARAILGQVERFVLEPAKEMEARYAAALEGVGPTSKDNGGRLAKGLRTSEASFVLPILSALRDLGGRSTMHRVLEIVGEVMKDSLRDVDFQPLSSEPGKPRWHNTAQWARNTMVTEGLLRNDSPRGIWAISDDGRRYLQESAES